MVSKRKWVKQTIDSDTRDILMALANRMHRTVPEVIRYMADREINTHEIEERTIGAGILECIAKGDDR